MKLITRPIVILFAVIMFHAHSASADQQSDHKDIERVLLTYEKALNASDTNAVLALYANDGVFMPQHSMPSVGKTAIRTAYDAVFKAIKLDVQFQIDEINRVSSEWAFARTRSQGSVTIIENGNKAPEGNQELFVLQKQKGGNWLIARYIFSTTNPR